jgi:uncharacterized membrane protein
MNIKNFIKIFVILILIDLVWLKFFAGPKYKVMIRDIQGSEMKPKIVPAIIVYILMALLLLLFGTTDIRNFILGVCVFGVYDMTNLTLLNKFDTTYAVADMIWGGILFVLTYKLHGMINL